MCVFFKRIVNCEEFCFRSLQLHLKITGMGDTVAQWLALTPHSKKDESLFVSVWPYDELATLPGRQDPADRQSRYR